MVANQARRAVRPTSHARMPSEERRQRHIQERAIYSLLEAAPPTLRHRNDDCRRLIRAAYLKFLPALARAHERSRAALGRGAAAAASSCYIAVTSVR